VVSAAPAAKTPANDDGDDEEEPKASGKAAA
jgi:hypothetical protein